jgi:hypothetical protein
MRAEYVWRESYQAAILETDDRKLPQRLQVAKAAIDDRLHELQLATSPRSSELPRWWSRTRADVFVPFGLLPESVHRP